MHRTWKQLLPSLLTRAKISKQQKLTTGAPKQGYHNSFDLTRIQIFLRNTTLQEKYIETINQL